MEIIARELDAFHCELMVKNIQPYMQVAIATQLSYGVSYMENIWWGKISQRTNLANLELFTKIFLTNCNIHRYTENVLGICTDYSLFALPIAFTCMVRQNFPDQIFPLQLQYIQETQQVKHSDVYICTIFLQSFIEQKKHLEFKATNYKVKQGQQLVANCRVTYITTQLHGKAFIIAI